MRLTISTWTAWLTNSTRPTLTRCARLQRRAVGARLALEPARLARDADGQEGGAEDDEEADHRRRRRTSLISAEDVPHLLGREREQGEDRQQRHRLGEQAERGGELAREPRRAPSAGSPAGRRRRPRRSRARIARLAAIVTAALPSWPPKISGSSAGRTTNAGELGLAEPARDRAAAGGPGATLIAAIPASRTRGRRAPRAGSATRSSRAARRRAARAKKIRPSSGAARLKTSVEAEKPSTNSGSPARRNWRS